MASNENLAAALVAALGELSVIEVSKTATIESKTGASYSYRYSDIADVVKLTRPVLAKNGLVALTPIHAHDGALACTVILLHTSGEQMEFGPLPFSPGTDAQSTGSAITYHRRYALLAALGMATEDDDGQKARPSKSERGRGQRKCVVCDRPLTGTAVPGGGGFAHPDCVQPAGNPDEEPF